jgi:mannose-6-phosphate isomerase-like protein (cupin superfamily)
MAEADMFSEEEPGSFAQQVPGYEGLELRRLTHVEKYTNGKWGGVIVRRQPGTQFAGSSWRMHELDLQYRYIVKGWAVVELEGRSAVRIEAGSSMVQPSMNRHRLVELSEDLIAIEVSSPAKFPTTAWVWDDEAQAYDTISVHSSDDFEAVSRP